MNQGKSVFGMGIVIALICLALPSSSFAGEAKCGDSRKIGRDSSQDFDAASCVDYEEQMEAKAVVEQQAVQASLERLQKFDSECERLPGGRIETISIDPRSSTTMNWYTMRDTHCEYIWTSHGNRQVCKDFDRPDRPYCTASAHADITHKCVCN